MSLREREESDIEDYRGSEELDSPFWPIQVGGAARAIIAAIENAEAIKPQCESPIEVQFAARLMVDLKPPFRLEPQYWLGRFRMDFAIIRDGFPCLFIECDGRAFHSSEEQIANDLDKDRAAARAGIPLLRFTGSSIFRRPDECAKKIIALLEGAA